jgi:hypothetical protein
LLAIYETGKNGHCDENVVRTEELGEDALDDLILVVGRRRAISMCRSMIHLSVVNFQGGERWMRRSHTSELPGRAATGPEDVGCVRRYRVPQPALHVNGEHTAAGKQEVLAGSTEGTESGQHVGRKGGRGGATEGTERGM